MGREGRRFATKNDARDRALVASDEKAAIAQNRRVQIDRRAAFEALPFAVFHGADRDEAALTHRRDVDSIGRDAADIQLIGAARLTEREPVPTIPTEDPWAARGEAERRRAEREIVDSAEVAEAFDGPFGRRHEDVGVGRIVRPRVGRVGITRLDIAGHRIGRVGARVPDLARIGVAIDIGRHPFELATTREHEERDGGHGGSHG